MLTTLHNDLLTRHQQQSSKVSGILDSLRIRNEVINKHLQNVITVVDAKVNSGIAKREQQIKDIENRNPYYYICMLSSLIPVFIIMFVLVKKFAARMRKSQADMELLIAELQEANRQNQELLSSRRKTLLTIVHELRSPLSAISSESAQMLHERDHISCERMTGIYQSSKMMSEMIDGLLTFYRLDSGKERLSGKVLGMFFLFHSILYLCIMNMLEQLARIVLPKEILDNFDIVKIETDESDIDSMSMTIYLDERMNAYLQKSEDYESKGFMDAVRITDFPIRDHKVILVLRRRRWKNKETGETFVDRISVTESGTRYSKEFAAFLKETYGHIPDDLPYA